VPDLPAHTLLKDTDVMKLDACAVVFFDITVAIPHLSPTTADLPDRLVLVAGDADRST